MTARPLSEQPQVVSVAPKFEVTNQLTAKRWAANIVGSMSPETGGLATILMTRAAIDHLPLLAEQLHVKFQNVDLVAVSLRHIAYLMGGVLGVGLFSRERPAESSEPAVLGSSPTGQ